MKYQKGELGEIENSNNVKGYLTFYPFSSLRKDTEGIWIKYKGRDNSESLQKLFKEKSIDFRKIDFKNDNIYKVAGYGALVIGLIDIIDDAIGVPFMQLLPLAKFGFSWVTPVVVLGIIGALIPCKKEKV